MNVNNNQIFIQQTNQNNNQWQDTFNPDHYNAIANQVVSLIRNQDMTRGWPIEKINQFVLGHMNQVWHQASSVPNFMELAAKIPDVAKNIAKNENPPQWRSAWDKEKRSRLFQDIVNKIHNQYLTKEWPIEQIQRFVFEQLNQSWGSALTLTDFNQRIENIPNLARIAANNMFMQQTQRGPNRPHSSFGNLEMQNQMRNMFQLVNQQVFSGKGTPSRIQLFIYDQMRIARVEAVSEEDFQQKINVIPQKTAQIFAKAVHLQEQKKVIKEIEEEALQFGIILPLKKPS